MPSAESAPIPIEPEDRRSTLTDFGAPPYLTPVPDAPQKLYDHQKPGSIPTSPKLPKRVDVLSTDTGKVTPPLKEITLDDAGNAVK